MYPPQPKLSTAPRLREPLWQRQDGEQDEDWEAFGTWVDCRDWHQVGAICGLTQQEALETATRWAWHARTRAWDAEHEREGATERKAHQAAVLGAREALPELIQLAKLGTAELLNLAHDQLVRHTAMAHSFATGEAGSARQPYLSWADVLRALRVGQQAVRDLERMARPIGPDSLGEVGGAKDGQWDFSKLPSEQLRLVQLARAASAKT